MTTRTPDDPGPARVARSGVARVRIDLAYDGTGFAGFAQQPDQVTVQGSVNAALTRLLDQPVVTTGAGRTDRGVHALGQVIHLDVEVAVGRAPVLMAARDLGAGRDLEVLRGRLDHLVGPAITVWRAQRVGAGFDARFSAVSRAYRYRLVDDLAGDDPIRRYDRWHVGAPLDVAAMRAALEHLVGEHDFASFCRRAEGRTTVRRIDVVGVHRPSRGRIDVRLVGPAFCHQQVRSIVGCLVEVGRGRRDPGWLRTVLDARDRAVAARVAPPQGLTLERVSYGRSWPASPPRWVAGRASSG